MRDLQTKGSIYLKAALFLTIGLVAVGLLIEQNRDLKTVVLLALVIWSFARLYYFCFYVIERYVDPKFRFSGLFSAMKYLLNRRSGQ